MRLWSLHPKYLDARGLVAVWREALLAQAVLRGETAGYRYHPQLQRFRAQRSPLGAIADYLRGVYEEATRRGYRFSPDRIGPAEGCGFIHVTRGQIECERRHLLSKLAIRDLQAFNQLERIRCLQPHPLFRVIPGGIEKWEKGSDR